MKTRVIIAVMNTTQTIVKMKPEKKVVCCSIVHRKVRVLIILQILDCHWLGRNEMQLEKKNANSFLHSALVRTSKIFATLLYDRLN